MELFVDNATETTLNNVNYEYYIVKFQFYYTPVLVHFGVLGNILSVYVFFNTKLRKLSSSYYLAALAISDSLFLIFLFIVWLTFVGIDWFNRPVVCQIMIYSSYVCSFLSVWLVVAFTIERFVAVRYPLLRQSICTVSRAKLVVVILVIVSMLLYSPFTIFSVVRHENNTQKMMCTNDEQWKEADGILQIVDLVITILIPVCTITVLNTLISRTIWKLSNVRKRLTQRGPEAKTKRKDNLLSRNKTKSSVSTQNKITRMLLIVSTVCLLMTSPSYIMRVFGTFFSQLEIFKTQTRAFIFLQHIFLQLFNTNFGINFALYCISGQNFRKAVKTIICLRKLRRNDTRGTGTTDTRMNSSGSSVTSRKRKTPQPVELHEMTTVTSFKTKDDRNV